MALLPNNVSSAHIPRARPATAPRQGRFWSVAVLIAIGLTAVGWALSRASSREPAGTEGGTAAAASAAPPLAPLAAPRSYYVAPGGTADADGTLEHPLDLTTALSEKSPAKPGDTVWLRGGRYSGSFTSVLAGRDGAPIVVRQYEGEHATIDSAPSPESALKAKGEWTWFVGFEIMNSDPERSSRQAGVWPTDLHRGPGVTALGSHLKFIDLVIHDASSGIATEPPSIDTELYGNVIYDNGWQGPDAAQGHGITTQNVQGTRRVSENIVFNQFSDGLYAYGSNLDRIELEGNVVFNNGALSEKHGQRNILLGGGSVADRPVLRANYTYFDTALDAGGENNIGYSAGCAHLIAEGNYWVGGNPVNFIKCDADARFADNVLVGRIQAGLQAKFPSNTYSATPPTETHVFVRPNHYEAGRANVVVFNWQKAASVTVDLGQAGLKSGDRYEVLDAQNILGKPVAAGQYEGTAIALALTPGSLASPIGDVPSRPVHTSPDFSAFVVVKRAASAHGGR